MNTESADHGDGHAFGFGLAQSGNTTIHNCFWVLLFYFSTHYYTFTAGLVASANLLFVGFGFSVILSLPKACARPCSYECVRVHTTVRGRVGVQLSISFHSRQTALDFHLFIKNPITQVHIKSSHIDSILEDASRFTMFLHSITLAKLKNSKCTHANMIT